MRAIDGDALLERACNLEAQALAYVGKIANDESKIEEWKIWSAILAERTAFKHDIFDAPTIEPKIVRCKDCMHYGTYYRGNESKPVITHLCKWCLDRTMEPDDFCSHAERR